MHLKITARFRQSESSICGPMSIIAIHVVMQRSRLDLHFSRGEGEVRRFKVERGLARLILLVTHLYFIITGKSQ